MNENLTSRTLRGLKWSYFSTIINAVLQIGFTAIMARLLEPAAFGLVAMAGIILRFGGYFAQMGIGQALVQKPELTEDEIHAAFTISVLLGLAFSFLTYLIAPLGLYVFNAPDVVPVIRWMGSSFLLSGLSTTATSLLRRKLDFRSLAIIEIISYVIGYGLIGVILASSGLGVWSLVVASLSQSTLTVSLSYLYSRHEVALTFEWKFYRPLYSFGSRVSVISFLEFIGSNLDTLVIGRFLGTTPLGIYNRAFMLVNLPMQYATSGFSRVLLPSFSTIQKEIPRIRKAYLSSIMLVGSFLIPTCVGIMGSSREIVLLLLGDTWAAAIPVLSILALATPLNLLSHLGGVACEATATLNIKFLIQTAYLVILGTLFYFLKNLGIVGFAMAVVIAEFIRHIGYIFVMERLFQINTREMFRSYQTGLLSSLIVGISICSVAFLLRQANSPIWLSFSVEFVIGVSVLSSVLFLTKNGAKKELQERLYKSGITENDKAMKNRIFSRFKKILLTS